MGISFVMIDPEGIPVHVSGSMTPSVGDFQSESSAMTMNRFVAMPIG